jgi:hypothetical protein
MAQYVMDKVLVVMDIMVMVNVFVMDYIGEITVQINVPQLVLYVLIVVFVVKLMAHVFVTEDIMDQYANTHVFLILFHHVRTIL